ncbi:phage tail tape measure protein [Bariatricus massiliensis]|uniref:phage tail tape measure protein n=1 Tax=Bariatricus massiliensis TaxID=1745713 RepID=UPI000829F8AB|nr:phage tail tape measure protein [Bariatricus massiliensis]
MASDGSIKITTELDNAKTEKAMAKFEGTARKGLTGVKIAAAAAGAAFTTALTATAVYAVKTGIEFESAFAGVKKTVNATDEELGIMRQGIRDMAKDIPQTASSIANVAEAAGQLGIKNENIMGFTRTMSDLGVATNMSATEAATSLARLANITQMPQECFENLGSVVVDLGNNLATTESEVVEMGLRLAGAGKQVGMSEAKILGLSGAISSVGISADAGGSAVSTVMAKMQLAVETGGESLEEFASVAGMTGEEFKTAFQQDAAQALVSFITGLANMDESGKSAIATLDEMGITEIRQRDALLRLSGAGDVLSKSLDIATQAWDDNNALTKEAEQRYETLESRIQIFKNNIADFGISIYDNMREPLKVAVDAGIDGVGRLQEAFESGGIKSVVEEAGDIFNDFSDKVSESNETVGNLVTPVKNIVNIGGNLAKVTFPAVVKAIELFTKNMDVAVPLVTTGVVALKSYNSITKAVTTATKANAAATTILNRMEKANALQTVAINGGLTIRQTLMALYNGQIGVTTALTGLWTKAQTSLNIAMSSNPIGIVVTAVAALAAGLGAYALITDSSAEKTDKHAKEQEELRERVEETTKAVREAKEARDEAVSGVLAESAHTQELADELRGIVDENGRVKEGYEARAAFITSTLAEALGIEIELVDGQIQGYEELAGAIDKAIEKKKAEAILSAYEASYNEAIKNRSNALKDLLSSQEASAEASSKLAEKQTQLGIANAKAREEEEKYGQVSDVTAALQTGAAYAVEKAKEAYEEEQKALQEASDSYEHYNSTIQAYEGLSAAIISGDSVAIQDALMAIQTGFKTHGQATDQELKNQAVKAGENMVLLGDAIKNGTIAATDSAVTEFANMSAMSLAELAKLPGGAAAVAKDIDPAMLGQLAALSGSLNNESRAAVTSFLEGLKGVDEGTRKKFEQAVQGAIEGSEFGGEVAAKADELGCSYLDALAAVLQVHSPSRAVHDIFSQVVPGAVEGVEEGKEGLIQKGVGLVTDFLNGLKSSGGESEAQGIGSRIMQFFGIGAASQAGNSKASGKANADAANAGAGSVNPVNTGGIFGRLFSSGISGMLGSSQNAGRSNADAAKRGAGSIDPSTTGTSFGGRYASGVSSKSGASHKSGLELAQNANDGAGSKDSYTTGSNFGSGFVRGIGSWISSAASKAAELAKSALDSAKRVLGIASPSKEMKKVGRWYSQGFGLGIKQESKSATDAAEELSQNTLKAININEISQRLKDIDVPDIMSQIYAVVEDQHKIVADKIVVEIEAKELMKERKQADEISRNESVQQVINIYQPVKSPIETARELKKVGREIAFGKKQ